MLWINALSCLQLFSLLKENWSMVLRGRGAEAPWSPQKWPQSLQICRMTSRPRESVSATSPSLPPFCLHAPHFDLRLLFLFLFNFIGLTKKYQNISLHSRLRHSLKNLFEPLTALIMFVLQVGWSVSFQSDKEHIFRAVLTKSDNFLTS